MITFNKLGQYGRLGNQMFQIAGTIGLAIQHGLDYGFPEWENLDHKTRFNSKEDISIQKYFKNPLPLVDYTIDYQPKSFPWGYHNLPVYDNMNLMGHFQSEKYFRHCRGTILYYFQMHKLSNLKIPANAVALHIRLTDYDGNYHLRLDLDNYYRKALELFDSSYKIYVFSDDIPEAKKVLQNTSYEYVEGNNYMVDFYLMSLFPHFIIGNSTYSWWAAWLSQNPDKKIVAPLNWFGRVSKISARDIYCSNWRLV